MSGGRPVRAVVDPMIRIKEDHQVMTLTLTVTPDIEQALAEEASDRGTTPELLALDSLRKRFVNRPAQERSTREAGNLAELLEGHLGVLHSGEQVPGGARMSENGGDKFAAGMVEKRRRGRL